MQRHSSIRSATVLLALAGCDGGGPSSDFNVDVTPTEASLFSAAPGNSVTLSAIATDDEGQVLGGGTRTFTSGNTAVATVTDAGLVTALSAGTALITTTITLDGSSASATTAVAVEDAPVAATVRAPAFVFTPGTTDIQAGGSVTWNIESIHHAVDFTSAGAPADVPELTNASATRTFPGNGTFSYRCPIHPEMAGVVRVH